MHRITFFCDDKKLSDVMHALVGLSLGVPRVEPVINAEVAPDGSIKQRTNGQLIDLFAAYLKKSKQTEINAVFVRQFLTGIGMSPGSVNYVLTQAREAKMIKKVGAGNASRYAVLPRK